jgi:hypothetical protein
MFRCKPRVGDCETYDESTIVTWAVVGSVDEYSSSAAQDIINRFIGEDVYFTIDEVDYPTVCDIGEINYGGDCDICPYNTYQPFNGSSFCFSCPYDSVTFYDGARCEEKCHSGDYADGFVSFQITLDPCAVWNIVHLTRHICSSSSNFLADEVCTAVNWFYELSIENAISEELLSELLGPEICETNVS